MTDHCLQVFKIRMETSRGFFRIRRLERVCVLGSANPQNRGSTDVNSDIREKFESWSFGAEIVPVQHIAKNNAVGAVRCVVLGGSDRGETAGRHR